MNLDQRNAGLVRAVGSWSLAASIVNAVIGAGIYAVPAGLAASVGAFGPLVFLACGFAIGAIAVCFAEGGSRVPTSGGACGYVTEAFGPMAGCVTGLMLLCSDALGCAGLIAAFVDLATSFAPAAGVAFLRAFAIVAIVAALTKVNVGGVTKGTRLINVITLIKILPLVVFVAAGVFVINPAHLAPVSHVVPADAGRALILALFALTGMEASLNASGEVNAPARAIPKALGIAMITMVGLYVAIQTIAQGILGQSLAQSPAPLADAMATIHPSLRWLMIAGASVSMVGYAATDLLATPRILFSFGREGLLPRALGQVHPHTHAPNVAILVYAVVVCGLALSGSFTELAVLATLSAAGVYIAGCAAAWLLARRKVALAGAPLDFRWLAPAAGVGIASMILLIALAAWIEIAGLAALIAAGAVLYVTRKKAMDPAVAAG